MKQEIANWYSEASTPVKRVTDLVVGVGLFALLCGLIVGGIMVILVYIETLAVLVSGGALVFFLWAIGMNLMEWVVAEWGT